MPPTDRIDHLRQLEALVQAHGDQHLVDWFTDGLERFTKGEVRTLCGALKLRGGGQDSIATILARAERDRHLADAYALCNGAIERLAREVVSFERSTWRWACRYNDPPSRLNGLQFELFHAFQVAAKHGLKMPSSAKGLGRVVETE